MGRSSDLVEQQRRERAMLNRIRKMKREAVDEASYLERCRSIALEEGLRGSSVRSVVWRDMALGLENFRRIPYIEEYVAAEESTDAGETPKISSHHQHVDPVESSDESMSTLPRSPSQFSSDRRASVRETTTQRSDESHVCGPIDSDAEVVGKCTEWHGCTEEDGASTTLDPIGQGSVEHTPPSDEIHMRSSSTLTLDSSAAQFPENCHARVIEVDIARSLWTLYPVEEQRNAMRILLRQILLRILLNNPDAHYYQGLHELIGVVMYVMQPSVSLEVIVSVCDHCLRIHWRSFGTKTLQPSQAMLYAIHAVIAREDTELALALERCGVAPESHYAVSWLITWFAHVVNDTDVLARIFDILLSEPDDTTIIFFCAALVIRERDRVLAWIVSAEEDDMNDGDAMMLMAQVYGKLTNLPSVLFDAGLVEETMSALGEMTIRLKRKYSSYANEERENFAHGDIRKLGMLADANTRNAALRLLWRWLPREWRLPVESGSFWAQSVAVASAAVVAALWISTGLYGRRVAM